MTHSEHTTSMQDKSLTCAKPGFFHHGGVSTAPLLARAGGVLVLLYAGVVFLQTYPARRRRCELHSRTT
eukprot:715339-Amphidinium_carterae.1